MKPYLYALLLLVAATLSAHADPTTSRAIDLAGGALAFDAPEAWDSVTPGSRILEHELSVDAPEGSDAADARLTIMAAGGSVEANLSRWVGQFQTIDRSQDRDAPMKQEIEAGGMKGTLLDVSGTYLESAGGPFGPKTPREGYRLVGAIVQTKGSGNYFFKLIGPKATVDPAAETFREMVESLRKKEQESP
ncbi:hypothetical protein MalM25_35150 [Planctomycetes bacterium MalM25]|nr:hypothetical protein MalM25_35150 [Planctomycetes bacterium MalM25]